MTNLTDQLLPCPFCGSDVIMTTAGIERQPLKQVEIECRQCKTNQDTLTRGETVAETNRIAITKWNTRFKALSTGKGEKSAEKILKEALGEIRYSLNGSITNEQIIWAMKEYARCSSQPAPVSVEEIVRAITSQLHCEIIKDIPFNDRDIYFNDESRYTVQIRLSDLRTALQTLFSKK